MTHLIRAIITAKIATWSIFTLILMCLSYGMRVAAHRESFLVVLFITSVILGIVSLKNNEMYKRSFRVAMLATAGTLITVTFANIVWIAIIFWTLDLTLVVVASLELWQASYAWDDRISGSNAIRACVLEYLVISVPLIFAFRVFTSQSL